MFEHRSMQAEALERCVGRTRWCGWVPHVLLVDDNPGVRIKVRRRKLPVEERLQIGLDAIGGVAWSAVVLQYSEISGDDLRFESVESLTSRRTVRLSDVRSR